MAGDEHTASRNFKWQISNFRIAMMDGRERLQLLTQEPVRKDSGKGSKSKRKEQK
jgi:hypothetical protein